MAGKDDAKAKTTSGYDQKLIKVKYEKTPYTTRLASIMLRFLPNDGAI